MGVCVTDWQQCGLRDRPARLEPQDTAYEMHQTISASSSCLANTWWSIDASLCPRVCERLPTLVPCVVLAHAVHCLRTCLVNSLIISSRERDCCKWSTTGRLMPVTLCRSCFRWCPYRCCWQHLHCYGCPLVCCRCCGRACQRGCQRCFCRGSCRHQLAGGRRLGPCGSGHRRIRY